MYNADYIDTIFLLYVYKADKKYELRCVNNDDVSFIHNNIHMSCTVFRPPAQTAHAPPCVCTALRSRRSWKDRDGFLEHAERSQSTLSDLTDGRRLLLITLVRAKLETVCSFCFITGLFVFALFKKNFFILAPRYQCFVSFSLVRSSHPVQIATLRGPSTFPVIWFLLYYTPKSGMGRS